MNYQEQNRKAVKILNKWYDEHPGACEPDFSDTITMIMEGLEQGHKDGFQEGKQKGFDKAKEWAAKLMDKQVDRCWGILDRLAKTVRSWNYSDEHVAFYE